MGALLSYWGLVPGDFIQALLALQYHFPRRKRGPASGKSWSGLGKCRVYSIAGHPPKCCLPVSPGSECSPQLSTLGQALGR